MKKSILLTAAVAGVLGGCATGSMSESSKMSMVPCMGINGCAGKGSCKTEANNCKGQNSCKGKGVVMTESEAKCKSEGGKVASK